MKRRTFETNKHSINSLFEWRVDAYHLIYEDVLKQDRFSSSNISGVEKTLSLAAEDTGVKKIREPTDNRYGNWDFWV